MLKFEKGFRFRTMTRQEVRAVDKWAINKIGIPGVVLMENAGKSCAEYIIARLRKTHNPRICILCGPGNNGGDGFVIARHLENNQLSLRIIIVGDPARIKGDALINYNIILNMGLPIDYLDPAQDYNKYIGECTANCHMIVDALLGTGLQGQLKPDMARLIKAVNEQGKPVIAVDIPSGLDCDTGLPLGTAIRAAVTVTFVAVKKGFLNESARAYTGEIFVASIGLNPPSDSELLQYQ